MQAYVARRLLLFVPTLFGASLLIFVLMRMVRGDIAQIYTHVLNRGPSGVRSTLDGMLDA